MIGNLDSRGFILALLGLMLFGAATSFGEDIGTPDLLGNALSKSGASNGGDPSGESLASDITKDITSRSDTKSIAFSDKEGQDNDRRKQYEAARDRANKGKAVAIATGAALTATAVPMLASPIASVRAAGAALMAKAALEFAQAAADKKVADENNRSADKVKQKEEGDGKGQAQDQQKQESKGEDTAKEAADKINTPEMNKLLTDRGVSSEDFANRLANGELTNPEDVLKAVGDNSAISPADMAQGEVMAQKEMGSADMKRLGYDESNVSSAATTAGGGGGGFNYAAESSKGSSISDILAQAGASPSSVAKNFAPNNTSPGASSTSVGKAGTADAPDILDIFAAMNGISREAASKVPIGEVLEAVGISKPQPRQNVFQIAHRNFRGYGKWRRHQLKKKKPKVVAMRTAER